VLAAVPQMFDGRVPQTAQALENIADGAAVPDSPGALVVGAHLLVNRPIDVANHAHAMGWSPAPPARFRAGRPYADRLGIADESRTRFESALCVRGYGTPYSSRPADDGRAYALSSCGRRSGDLPWAPRFESSVRFCDTLPEAGGR